MVAVQLLGLSVMAATPTANSAPRRSVPSDPPTSSRLVAPSPAIGVFSITTRKVGPDGASCAPDYTVGIDGASASFAIQRAVDAAADGDTIFLCTGTYDLTTGIVVSGKNLTFQGEETANTSISGGGVVRIISAAGLTITVAGLTLTRGYASNTYGGAVSAASVTAIGSRFVANRAWTYGGVVYATGDVTVIDSEFVENTAGQTGDHGGGAIYAGSGVTVVDSVFVRNRSTAGGAIRTPGRTSSIRSDFSANTSSGPGGALYTGSLEVSTGTFEGNNSSGGGAIQVEGGTISITDASFISNRTPGAGGAISVVGLGPMESTSSRYVDNSSGTIYSGGAINANSNAIVVTSRSDVFEGNRAGSIGGAISTLGTIVVVGGTFRDNTAGSTGGALRAATVVVGSRSLFAGNEAAGGGAIIAGSVTIGDSGFFANRAVNGAGGAVYAGAVVEITTGSTFVGNRASGAGGAGGAVYVGDGTGRRVSVVEARFEENSAETDGGGAIHSDSTGRFTIVRTEFVANASSGKGGAVYARAPLDLQGGEFSANTASDQGGAVFAQDALSISDGSYHENVAVVDGGAIHSWGIVTLHGGSYHDNVAGRNGGAVSAAVGSVTVTAIDADFTANTAGQSGGAIASTVSVTSSGSRFVGNRALGGNGGAIGASTWVTVTESVFVRNRARAFGGAIVATQNVTSTADTFHANEATAGSGGAVAVLNGGVALESIDDTFVENSAATAGGAIALTNSGHARLSYVTFVDNTAATAGTVSGTGNASSARGVLFVGEDGGCAGVVGLAGVLTTAPGCPGLLVDRTALLLGPLTGANGGPTPTIALARGSVAIDPTTGEYGPCTAAESATMIPGDQRREPRPMFGACDSGAYEYQGPPDRTTALRIRAYVGGLEVAPGALLTPGVTVEIRAEVTSDPEVTTGAVAFRSCFNLASIPAACPTTAYVMARVAVTDGTSGSDGIAEATYLWQPQAAGFYRLGASYAARGGQLGSSEVTAGTPSVALAEPVTISAEMTGGSAVVPANQSFTLRASVQLLGGGLPTSACTVGFTVGGTTTSASLSSGVASATIPGGLPTGVHLLTVTTGDGCVAPLPAFGVVTAGSTAAPPRGTIAAIAGGRHFVTGVSGETIAFGLRVDTTSGAVAKGSKVIGYRTNLAFAWVSSAGWRLTSTVTGDYTTGASGPYAKSSCTGFTASDGTSLGAALPSRGYLCGQLTYRGTLQEWSTGTGGWGTGQEISFAARFADGGSSKGVDGPDWFGLQFAPVTGPTSITGVRPLRLGTVAPFTYLGRTFVY